MSIGKAGENLFRTMCDEADLVHNKAHNDERGWDFIVDLPEKFNYDLKTYENPDAHDKLLFQVKTSKERFGNRQIKLSNIRRLVNSSLPSFYFLVHVSDDRKPLNVDLIHVWHEVIEITQKRLRELGLKEQEKLNKHSISLPKESAISITNFHGRDLLSALEDILTQSKSKYVKEKKKIRETVGFDKEMGKLTFTGLLPEKYKDNPEEFFVDLTLGLIGDVKIENYSLISTRFGIDAVQKTGESGKINITPHKTAKSKLYLNSLDYSSNWNMELDLYIPSGMPKGIKKVNLKILLSAPYIQIIIYPYTGKIDLNLGLKKLDEKIAISDVQNVSNLIVFLSQLSSNESLRLKLIANRDTILNGESWLNTKFEDSKIEAYKALKNTYSILHFFDLDKNTEVNPINLWNQRDVINFLAKLFLPKTLNVHVDFKLDADLKNYEETKLLIPTTISIGNKIIAILLIVSGDADSLEKKKNQYAYKFHSNKIELTQHRIIDSNEKEKVKDLHSQMHDIEIKRYENDDSLMLVYPI